MFRNQLEIFQIVLQLNTIIIVLFELKTSRVKLYTIGKNMEHLESTIEALVF